MKNSIVKEKSYAFALRMVKMYQHLTVEKREFVLSKQVLRSGTSVGANIEEANGAQSDADFYAKINIAYKEARETHYWLRLLKDSEYLDEKSASSIIADCDELLKMLASIKISMKNKLSKNS